MKAINLNLTLIFSVIFALISFPKTSAETADSLIYENDSVFTIESVQKELSDEGEWIKVNKDEVDPEGVTDGSGEMDDDINTDYVWRPYNVDPDWSPYTNGYWVYTNCGWMWVSYYHWGWRTCHYGRWWWSPVWGWVWSPGFVWAPAWVVWMFDDYYCGWYPISPRIRWHKHHGWRCHNMRFHVRHWKFCHKKDYKSPINITVIIDPPGIKNIINRAKFVSDINVENGRIINKGPEVTEIEKSTGQKISTENVTKYNNVKVITTNEKQFENEKSNYNEKKSNNEKQNNTEKQSGMEKEKYKNNDGEKKQRNDDGKKTEEKNYNNEKKSNNNDGVKKEKSYEKPKNNNSGEKKQNYEKPKDNNSGEKKQSYESPKKNDDGYNNSKKNDSQKSNDTPKDKGNGNNKGNDDNVKKKEKQN